MLSSHVADLSCLSRGELLGVVEVGVNELLVLKIDQRAKEEEGIEDQSQAPERKPLDQPVGDERGGECQKSCPDVLDEDDTLELDDEEVDELLGVVQEALKGLLGDDEVLARSHLGGNAIAKESLAYNLGRSSGAEHDVEGLEGVADDVQVASGEDEENGRSEGDAGCAWVLPLVKLLDVAVICEFRLQTYAQEAVEHGVVV